MFYLLLGLANLQLEGDVAVGDKVLEGHQVIFGLDLGLGGGVLEEDADVVLGLLVDGGGQSEESLVGLDFLEGKSELLNLNALCH